MLVMADRYWRFSTEMVHLRQECQMLTFRKLFADFAWQGFRNFMDAEIGIFHLQL